MLTCITYEISFLQVVPPERTQPPPQGRAVPRRAAQDPKSLVKARCPPDVWPVLEAVMGHMNPLMLLPP